jgi:hypothetical protein
MRKHIKLFEEYNSSQIFENFTEETAIQLVSDVKEYLEKRDIDVSVGPITTQAYLASTNSEASMQFNKMASPKKAVIWIRDVADAGENDYWSKDAPMWVELLVSPNIVDDIKEIASPQTTDGLLSFIGDTNMILSDKIADKAGWVSVKIQGKTNIGWKTNPEWEKMKPAASSFGQTGLYSPSKEKPPIGWS